MANSIVKHRRAAFQRQGGRCYYCDLPMWIEHPTAFARKARLRRSDTAQLRCTAEHLIARQDGGRNSGDNIVAACLFCNSTRHRALSPLDPERYRQRVSHRLRAGKWHSKSLVDMMSELAPRGSINP
jgi:5-methylcytosine-specific restriction endonuclease McrA